MVVVFGSINIDLVARVARIPGPGETLSAQAFTSIPGGKGANQALAARLAGADVRLYGAVGRDHFASEALSNLETAGVDLSGVASVASRTGVALIHVDDDGENAITVHDGANSEARAAQVPDSVLGPGTTLLMQLEVPLAEVTGLASRGRSLGATIVLNAAPAAALPDELLRCVDVLVVNETEAAAIGAAFVPSTEAEISAHAVAARHACAVVVTLGSRGLIAVRGDEHIRIAAPATRVLDTTGAGDALAGALAAALDRRTTFRQALAEGVAAGSLACTGHGAQFALPARAAIAALAATL